MKSIRTLAISLPVLLLVAPAPAPAAYFDGYAFTAIDLYVGDTSYSGAGSSNDNLAYGGVYQPRLSNGLTAYSAHSDIAYNSVQAVSSLAIYGSDSSRTGYVPDPGQTLSGVGVEPMIDISLSTSPRAFSGMYYGESSPIDAVPLALAQGSVSVQHRVRLNQALPAEVDVAYLLNNVPLTVDWRYDIAGAGNVEGQFAILVDSPTGDCASGVGGLCGGFGVSSDDPGFLPANSGSIPFTAVASTEAREAIFDIQLSAYAAAGEGSFLRGVIDPYLSVDADWEYASYFIVEQESTLSPGDWVTIDRNYLNAVPVPPAVWLFGSGLIGLLGVARMKRA